MRRKIAVNPSEADKGQMKGLVEMINQSSDPMLILFNSVINSEMVKRMPEWVQERQQKRSKVQVIVQDIFYKFNAKSIVGLTMIAIAIVKDIMYPSTVVDAVLLGFGLGLLMSGMRG